MDPMRLFSIVTIGLLIPLGQLRAAVTIDTQALLPGGRTAAEDLELVSQLGSFADLWSVKGQTLASGFVGQISNQAPQPVDPGTLPATFQQARAIDIDATDGDGDRIVYRVTQAPAHGILSGTGPDFIYTPVSGYRGPDQFQLHVHDGADRSPDLTVSIQVGPWRSIRIRLQPDGAGQVGVEARPLPIGEPVEGPYLDDVGATLEPLAPDLDHRLIWVLGGPT